ncbi:hypothetical protein BDV12DRAFT_207815 [Aspergillus spectabilis]
MVMPKGPLSTLDDYQRPVQWLLTSTVCSSWNGNTVKHMVTIGPFEADEIHSEIRKSSAGVTMHLYAPRQNRSYSPLDKFELYSVPSTNTDALDIPTTLKVPINSFAGQLYISSYQDYLEICNVLGLSSAKAPEDMKVAADGFMVGKDPSVLMSQIRRDGQEIDKTRLGKIFDGKLLGADDFQDVDDELV